MPRLLASLSVDLDNKWSYMKTHGDAGWEQFPSYLDIVIPRMLEMFASFELSVTCFIVGQDAAIEGNQPVLQSLADAGHEIGNHSFHHDPWLHRFGELEIAAELDRAEAAIEQATGRQPLGFRGPGFSYSTEVLVELARRGYEYDATTFPTFIGPLARAYYFMISRLSPEQKSVRKKLFGNWREGFRSIRPYYWSNISPPLLEIPVTTMPIFRVPIHLSYVHFLAGYSRRLALLYFRSSLALIRLMRVEPSLLLHPLDFLGCDDDDQLQFFPGMKHLAASKLQLTRQAIQLLDQSFEVLTLGEHANRIKLRMQRAQSRPAAFPS